MGASPRPRDVRSTLLMAGVMALVAAIVYAYVARRVRPAPGAGSRALRMFALWWDALAVNLALVALTYLLGAFDALTFEVQLVDSYLQRLLLGVSLVGLMHYLLFLLTGRDLLWQLAAAYGTYFLLITGAFFYQEPSTLFIGEWRTDVVFARPELRWVQALSLVFVLLPPVIASAAYLRLYFRIEDPERRWRIALVSVAILVWWAVAVVAGQRELLDVGGVQVANRVLSVMAALAVLAAYEPPDWLRRRWEGAAR